MYCYLEFSRIFFLHLRRGVLPQQSRERFGSWRQDSIYAPSKSLTIFTTEKMRSSWSIVARWRHFSCSLSVSRALIAHARSHACAAVNGASPRAEKKCRDRRSSRGTQAVTKARGYSDNREPERWRDSGRSWHVRVLVSAEETRSIRRVVENARDFPRITPIGRVAFYICVCHVK